MDASKKSDGSWGMSAPRMSKKHRLDAKTIAIDAPSGSISVKPDQILKICAAMGSGGSKS